MIADWRQAGRRVLLSILLPAIAFSSSAVIAAPVDTPPASPAAFVKPVLINGNNVGQFRNSLVPEMFPLVKEGLVQVNVQPSLSSAWELDAAWEKASAKPDPSMALLVNQGAIPEQFVLPRAFPFGREDALKSSGREMAGRILWNMAANFWGQHAIQIEWKIRDVDRNGERASYNALFRRLYPLSMNTKERPKQLFRELLRFKTPPAASSLAFLTFRFAQRDEDFLWTLSPAIGKVRQLTGSNRGDPIAGLPSSLDDLVGWSGNPYFVDAELTAEKEFLLPFPKAWNSLLRRTSSDEKDNFCYQVDPPSGTHAFVEWNVDSKDAAVPSWMPSSIVFVPRTAWRIEVASRDPYSLVGRQILYVDKESMLPLVTIVFDKAGKLWKLVLSGFGLAEGSGKKAPYEAFSVVYSFVDAQAALFTPLSISYCDMFFPDATFADFDPSRLVSAPKAKQKDKKAVINTPAPGNTQPPVTDQEVLD